jgi:hypothetical protein
MPSFDEALQILKRAAARGGIRAGAALLDSLAADGQSVLGGFAKEIGVGRSLLKELIPSADEELRRDQDDERPARTRRPRKIGVAAKVVR